jgi:hypothetical protein
VLARLLLLRPAMSRSQVVVPRVMAGALLVVSVATFAPLVRVVIRMIRGEVVPRFAWVAPLIVLATGALLTWLLARAHVSMRLYVTALTLWLITAAYLLMLGG